MLEQTLIISNKLGLHARAAMLLINTASRYQSKIMLQHKDREVNAKSILCVMALGAAQGSEIKLIITGEDEQQAMQALSTLINNKFNEAE